ncbi:hypothetical protein QMK19_30250 [Streptomyces sp. H10-C2]|uniref:hypothetical protein n=1 Tax=unclassified Streptomyces TaxID=2593676 RepID=UPI0024BAB4D0|nr:MULTISPECIES: hypothetical protein [unclassified Streptomyces]MDJ0344927.1 hypothetical protein [Streptomyces sp. PH10-H1]MDJ0373815.1 hypothetical protein [Streptomyces sp. H10-C2]
MSSSRSSCTLPILSGVLAAPATAASALASFAGDVLAAPLGGYPRFVGLLALASGLATLTALGTAHPHVKDR